MNRREAGNPHPAWLPGDKFRTQHESALRTHAKEVHAKLPGIAKDFGRILEGAIWHYGPDHDVRHGDFLEDYRLVESGGRGLARSRLLGPRGPSALPNSFHPFPSVSSQPCFGDGSERLALRLNGGLRVCEVNCGSGFGNQSDPRVADCVACAHARGPSISKVREGGEPARSVVVKQLVNGFASGSRTGTPAEPSGRISRRRFSANLGSLSTLRHHPQSFAGPEPG